MRRVRTALVGLALALAAAAPAVAQPADAIGKPLPDTSLKDGTVVVRLIAGDRSKPVSEAEVTLTITPPGGADPIEKRARTDAEGRATFVEIPENARVRATAQGEGEVVSSAAFPMPQSGGVRVMVSTIPAAGGGMGGGPMMGGEGGMPAPRQMSGQPRPEQADDGDTLTVRVTYDDFADPTPPKDLPVLLVDYRWDHIVSTKISKTDAGGRVVFRGLSRGGAHAYFVLTLLPRGDGFDRLISEPIVPPGDVGVRVLLSGEKRTVAAPVDDLAKIDPQAATAVPGGEVQVKLVGMAVPGLPLELVDVTTGEVVAKTKAEVSAEEAQQGQGGARFTGVPAGGPEKAYLVRAATSKDTYLSLPFQLTASKGASVTLTILPRVLMRFSMSAWVDDIYLGVRATITLQNSSWAPYVAGTNDKPEEVVIPLPKGFKGAEVAPQYAEVIGTDPTRGFVIRRPLPPWSSSFVAGFSLEHRGGQLVWDLPLPYGSVGSGMEINREGTGKTLRIDLNEVRDVEVREAQANGNDFFVLEPIYIEPGKRMVFTLTGLPQAPGWQRWAQNLTGLLVLAILAAGIGIAIWRRPARPAAGGKARFDQLLDELAALEAQPGGGDRARREQLMAELEELHRQGTPG